MTASSVIHNWEPSIRLRRLAEKRNGVIRLITPLYDDHRPLITAWPDIVSKYKIPMAISRCIWRAVTGISPCWYRGIPDEAPAHGCIEQCTVSEFIVGIEEDKWRIRQFGKTQRARLLSLVTNDTE